MKINPKKKQILNHRKLMKFQNPKKYKNQYQKNKIEINRQIKILKKKLNLNLIKMKISSLSSI